MSRGIAALVLSMMAAALLLPLRVRSASGESATMAGLRQLIGGSVIHWAAHLAPPSVRDMRWAAKAPSKPKPPAAAPTTRAPTARAPSGPSPLPAQTAPAPAVAPATGGLHLDGILLTPEPPTVMVNGQLLKIGEWIAGYRVVKIIPQGVYLHQPPDRWFLLTTDQQLRRVEVQ